ncbi:MAG: hypothetical protein JWR26_1200, partial [Pedosphaera sp.]|nr:hypothetical protein [Pedosphaera sp.]
MKTNHFLHYLCLPALCLCATNHLHANPVGGQVQAGNVTFGSSLPGTMIINQLSQNAIINWNDFSIAAGETTRFIQPSASAGVLNRVISSNPSLLFGSLQANGHVYLINQNGILVGPGGSVNTGGFVASALDINDASFLSGGTLTLSGRSTAMVKNQGSIQALGGDVFLIGHQVENSGSILAPQGTVGLAAGSTIQLVQSGQERISVLAGNGDAPQANVGVNNLGTIQATTAELKAAGGNIYALAINNGGAIRATSLVNENGRIVLKSTGGNIANSGTLSAQNANGSGGSIILDGGHNATLPATVTSSGTIDVSGTGVGTKGGNVQLVGDYVGLLGNAAVNASGNGGGGTVLIGGDLHGANSAVQDAQRTFVDTGASINTDALVSGNGGKVVVWSDEVTRFYGEITSRGGSQSGNGGSLEVSSSGQLEFDGTVNTLAPNGTIGNLLLDPHDLTVTATGTPGSIPTGFNNPTANGNSSVNDATVSTALNTSDVTLYANNDITLNRNANINSTSSHGLTMRAGDSIIFGDIGGGATVSVGGSFTATFNDSGATSADRDAGAANFTMNNGSSITAPGGISIQGGTLAANANGATTVNANTGDIILTILSTASGTAGASGGNISVVDNAPGTSGNITVLGNINSGGANNGAGAGGNGGTITLNASGTLTVNGALGSTGGNGTGGDGGSGGIVALTGGSGITLNQNVTTLGGTGTANGIAAAINLNAASGGVAQTGGTLVGASLALAGGGTFSLTDANNVNALSGTVAGAIAYHDANALTVNALSAGSGNINVSTTTGDLNVAGAVTTTGNASLTASGGNIVNGGGKVSANGVTLAANGANGSVAANTA